jgi:hypothetical protein
LYESKYSVFGRPKGFIEQTHFDDLGRFDHAGIIDDNTKRINQVIIFTMEIIPAAWWA